MEKKCSVPAKRMENVYASVPRKILERARQLEKQGRTIAHMEIGEPDFDTPRPIIDATIAAMNANKTHYESNRGNALLRKKICDEIFKSQGLKYDPDEEILMTAGVAPGIFYSVMAFAGEGDEVITFGPAFMNYDVDIMLAGATNVSVPLKPENGYKIDLADLEAAITPKTKMIIVNNPHNPTGVVHSEESLRGVAQLAIKYDLLVVSDEVYEKIVYDGGKCVSMAGFPGMRERTIILNGFSKAYAMTGWRMGYIAADASLFIPLLRVHQYMTVCIPTFTQAGLAEAIDHPDCLKAIDEMVAIFEERRNVLCSLLDQIPGITYVRPQGAFYVMVDISKLEMVDMDFALQLLEEENVAVCPASAFGPAYNRIIRLSYATSLEDIRFAMEHMEKFIRRILDEKK